MYIMFLLNMSPRGRYHVKILQMKNGKIRKMLVI